MILVLLGLVSFGKSQCPAIIGNCYVFPPTDEWNRPIDTDPVSYASSCIMPKVASLTTKLRLDLGTDPGQTWGMPYNIYTTQAPELTPMQYGTDGYNYQSESEWFYYNGSVVEAHGGTGPVNQTYFPFPTSAVIEGSNTTYTDPTSGDRHVLVVDAVNCMLYESWNSVRSGSGWETSNTAVWDMTLSNTQRPAGWTSADAAGMAIFPGVLRYSEITAAQADGTWVIPHALRFTAPSAQNAYATPGRHVGLNNNVAAQAGPNSLPRGVPCGTLRRLGR